MTGDRQVGEVYHEVDADGYGGTGPAMAQVLRAVAEVLEDAPEDRRYDFDLTIDERTAGSDGDADE